ncbi:ribonuclease H-like domain-containing protein [Tanacetum coccineum]
MQEELLQFKLQEVWTLVDLPNGKRAICTKWVFRNKKDERGIVIRNKARLVAQGYTQEEGIDYDEVFALVAIIDRQIRLFLAYASFKDFVVYQMDVKSAFLYEKIKEEVYVCQPPGFEDPDFPDRVYKFMWMISSLVQKRRSYALKFESLMHEKCHQDCKHTNRTQKPLLKDEDGKEVDVHMYRSMIGSLMYLTSSRPDIMFVVCAVLDTKSNLNNLHSFMLCKGFFREVQLQALVDGKKIIITESIVRIDLQLEDDEGVDCLSNASIFEQLTLIGSKTTTWNEFSSTMASAIICLATNQKFNFSKYIFKSMVKNLDNVFGKFLMYPRNMRRVGKGFSGRETPLFQTMMVQDQEEVGEGSEMPTDPHHTPTIIQPSTSQPQKKQRSRRSKRKDTKVPQPSGPTTNVFFYNDEDVNEEMDNSLERAATTTTGLDVEQDRGNINKTRSKATLNEPSSSGTSLGSSPRMVNTLRSGEDRLKLEELMALCTTLQSRVLALETTKTTQATEIASLKKRVKKLERRNKLRTHGLKRLYRVGSSRRVESSEDEGLGEEDASKQGRIADIDANEDIYLVNVQTDEDMFGVNDLDGDEVIVESVDVVKTAEETRSVVEEVTVVTIPVSAATTTTTTTAITDVEMTLAQALAELKSAKPKATTITTTPTLTTTTDATTITAVSTRPRAKGLVIHEQEQAPTPTVSSQQPLQVKAKIDADYQLAKSLQAQEQDEFTNVEKARLFVQFLEQRRKHFAAKRAEEKRNRPPTRAQQRSIITEMVEESSKKAEAEIAHESSLKRAGEELEQEISKKQKLEEDKESEELKQCLEIIPDDGDDVTIDATPLSTKSLTIVDYKIYKERKKSYFQIIIADVKARFKKIEPMNYMDNFLLLNLKTMFEHHVEDNNVLFYMLVEKIYPLTNHTLHQMFNDVKLQVDYEFEMAFKLLRLLLMKKLDDFGDKYQVYGRIVRIKSLLEVTAAKVCVTAAKQKLVLFINFNEKYAK